MRASLARQVKFSIVQYISVLYIFICGLHWLDRLSFQLFITTQFFIYIQMRASLARQVKFSIVQYSSVFSIYLNAVFTSSTG